MTCEDVKVMVTRDPRDCTRAERAAIAQHLADCQKCYESLKSSTDVLEMELVQDLGSKAVEIIKSEIKLSTSKMCEEDYKDPEVRSTKIDLPRHRPRG